MLSEPLLTARIHASASAALATPCDVFVEYTRPDAARSNILAALEHGRPREARGATVSGSQVHSIRLPVCVDGALLAIRRVSNLVGVHRGLDSVLDR